MQLLHPCLLLYIWRAWKINYVLFKSVLSKRNHTQIWCAVYCIILKQPRLWTWYHGKTELLGWLLGGMFKHILHVRSWLGWIPGDLKGRKRWSVMLFTKYVQLSVSWACRRFHILFHLLLNGSCPQIRPAGYTVRSRVSWIPCRDGRCLLHYNVDFPMAIVTLTTRASK